MNISFTRLDHKGFEKSNLQKKKYMNKLTNSSISSFVNSHIEDLRRQGYSEAQINAMDLKVYFYHL